MKIKKYQPTLSLKPTQFAVGLLEVEYKVIELKKLKKKKLQKLIDATPIPVVISPWKEICIIDHHHFLFACWHADIRKVRVDVVKDFSKNRLSYQQFWRKMGKLHYAYLFDQFGQGPRNPLYLPMDVRGMADDPYRSLAWIARKEGAYENSDKTFAEFAWADFFRDRKLLDTQGRRGFHKATERAVRLAKSKSAQKLPGYLNSKKLAKALKDKALPKSKYIPKAQDRGPLATQVKI